MDLYEILEVQPSASDEVIRMAYKGLVKKYHPDSYSGNKEDAEKKIKQINEAYEILSDKDKRTVYDERYYQKKSDDIKSGDGSRVNNDVSVPRPTYKKRFLVTIIEGIAGALFGIGKFLAGIVILYVVAGMITGNLHDWNAKAVYFSKVAIHFVNNMKGLDKYEDGTAENTIQQYINAIYDGDEYTALQKINRENNELEQQTKMLTTLFRQMEGDDTLQVLFQDMKEADYKVQAGDDEGWYIVTFQTCDYEMIIKQLEDQYGNIDLVKKQLNEKVRTAHKSYIKEALLHVERINSEWVIDEVEDELIFLNALTGNLFQLFTQIRY